MPATETADVIGCRQAVEADPFNETAVGVLADAYQDSGRTPVGARRLAKRFAGFCRAKRIVDTAPRVRGAIRGTFAGAPIEVVYGTFPPERSGEPAHHVFKNGGRCDHPGSAIKKGYKVRYVPSTIKFTVGALYVLKLAKRLAKVYGR